MMTPRLSRRSLIPWSFAAAAVIASCNLRNEGVTPPDAALSYPIALTISREPEPRFLYVANSNFDLRYNAGSVHAYDLQKLDTLLARYSCRAQPEDRDVPLSDGGTRVVPDGTRTPLLDAGLSIDAGMSTVGDAGMSLLGDGGTSADGGMSTLADAGMSTVDAGATGAGGIELPTDYGATSAYGNKRGSLCDGRDSASYARCCFTTRTAEEAAALGDRGLDELRSDAVRIDSFATGIALSPDSRRLYVPISSRSRVIYIDVGDGQLDCGTDGRCTRGPGLGRGDDDPDSDFAGQPTAIATGTLGELGLAESRDGLTPGTQYVATAHQLGGFSLYVEKDGAPLLEHVIGGLPVQQATSVTADPRHKLLYATFAAQTPTIARIAMRTDLEAYAGEAAPRELLHQTSRIVVTGLSQSGDLRDVAIDPSDPSRLFALVRGAQESVAFLQIDPSAPGATEARLIDAVRVGAGPSKLEYISIGGKAFLLVSCYDAKSIFIIDVQSRELVSVVRSLSGPHEMAFDPARKLLHVADFRSSVLRVVDLQWLWDKTEPPPRIVATLGSPRFEGGLE